MTPPSIPPIAAPQAAAGLIPLSARSLMQQIGILNAPQGLVDTELLRLALKPFPSNNFVIHQFSQSQDFRKDLVDFVEGRQAEPSQPLLETLNEKLGDFRVLVEGFHPEWFQVPDSGSMAARVERTALEYPEISEEARAQHAASIHEAVSRMLAGISDRARISLRATPKALSLKEVLESQAVWNEPLEIALFDVDGTTHKGELPIEGQYSLEWLVRDVLYYGPWATTGISWWRVAKAIPGIIKLRLQEKESGTADRDLFNRTFEPLLKGLDGRRAEVSFNRFYDNYGSRGISEFMREEFIRHRQANRLIIGASASHEYLVKRHAAKDMGIPEENMCATTIEIDPETQRGTGKFEWLHGKEKVNALEKKVYQPLREKGIPFKRVAGYSDSPSDQPMLDDVKKDGGLIFATNPSKEGFKTSVLADGGMVLEETDGWLDNGVRRLVFASAETGRLLHEEATPPRRPAWLGDVRRYTARITSDAAGFALAAPASEAIRQSIQPGGQAEWTWALFSSAPSLAVGGFFASALTMIWVPPNGPVSWQRHVFMRGMIPVAAAMAAAGMTGNLVPGFWASLAVDVPVALTTAAVAATGVEILTIGERLVGLRRWKGGDERKNYAGKVLGFFGLRTLQILAFRALTSFIQKIAGM